MRRHRRHVGHPFWFTIKLPEGRLSHSRATRGSSKLLAEDLLLVWQADSNRKVPRLGVFKHVTVWYHVSCVASGRFVKTVKAFRLRSLPGDADNTEFAKEVRDLCKSAIESGIKELQAKQAEARACFEIVSRYECWKLLRVIIEESKFGQGNVETKHSLKESQVWTHPASSRFQVG